MEHFWQSVPGFFNYAHFYERMVREAPDNAHFVEVGSWKGTSAAFMAVEILNSGKNIKFDCVDTWLGSEEHQGDSDVINGRLYETFINNMKPVKGHYTAIRLPSLEAAKLYADESLDFVFIDADHSTEAVTADILAWLPKVKPDGFITGHDFGYPPVRTAVFNLIPNVEGDGECWIKRKKDAEKA